MACRVAQEGFIPWETLQPLSTSGHGMRSTLVATISSFIFPWPLEYDMLFHGGGHVTENHPPPVKEQPRMVDGM